MTETKRIDAMYQQPTGVTDEAIRIQYIKLFLRQGDISDSRNAIELARWAIEQSCSAHTDWTREKIREVAAVGCEPCVCNCWATDIRSANTANKASAVTEAIADAVLARQEESETKKDAEIAELKKHLAKRGELLSKIEEHIDDYHDPMPQPVNTASWELDDPRWPERLREKLVASVAGRVALEVASVAGQPDRAEELAAYHNASLVYIENTNRAERERDEWKQAANQYGEENEKSRAEYHKKLADAGKKIAELSKRYGDICHMVASMHAAAVGSFRCPRRGFVNDVRDAIDAARTEHENRLCELLEKLPNVDEENAAFDPEVALLVNHNVRISDNQGETIVECVGFAPAIVALEKYVAEQEPVKQEPVKQTDEEAIAAARRELDSIGGKITCTDKIRGILNLAQRLVKENAELMEKTK